jgi:uncharacterized Fe-S cluster-containing radical SAM superfamily protein
MLPRPVLMLEGPVNGPFYRVTGVEPQQHFALIEDAVEYLWRMGHRFKMAVAVHGETLPPDEYEASVMTLDWLYGENITPEDIE